MCRIDFHGNVHKRMRGSGVAESYAKEVEVLKVLEERGCPYVPKLLEEHPEEFYFVSTNCGRPAPQVSKAKAEKLYAALGERLRRAPSGCGDEKYHLQRQDGSVLHHRFRAGRNPAESQPREGEARPCQIIERSVGRVPAKEARRKEMKRGLVGGLHRRRVAGSTVLGESGAGGTGDAGCDFRGFRRDGRRKRGRTGLRADHREAFSDHSRHVQSGRYRVVSGVPWNI